MQHYNRDKAWSYLWSHASQETGAEAPEITPAMIEAGLTVLLSYSVDELVESEEKQAQAVARIFEAMALVC